MTTYIYKGQKISHSKILSLLRSAGIYGGNKLSYYEVLVKAAENGNERGRSIFCRSSGKGNRPEGRGGIIERQ